MRLAGQKGSRRLEHVRLKKAARRLEGFEERFDLAAQFLVARRHLGEQRGATARLGLRDGPEQLVYLPPAFGVHFKAVLSNKC